jgi:hypothetical protein
MYRNNRNGRRAAGARGFAALLAVLAAGLGLMASPAEAAPLPLQQHKRLGVQAHANASSVCLSSASAVPVCGCSPCR